MTSLVLESSLGSVQQTVRPYGITRHRALRVMSWNVERLGDTGSLGRNGGRRKSDVLDTIARIILEADPAVCALLEVFLGDDGHGIAEANAILERMQSVVPGWRLAFSPPTGGFLDEAQQPSGQEGYALFVRFDLGLDVVDGAFIPVYPPQQNAQRTARGISVYRDPWEFTVGVDGGSQFALEAGRPWAFKVTAYHAPGPDEAPQRQEAIKGSIAQLGLHYQGSQEVVFICADFNANEAATNILGDPGNIEFDTSSPVNLDYLARAFMAVKLVYLVNIWAQKHPQLFDASALLQVIHSGDFANAVTAYDEDFLATLEDSAVGAHQIFSQHDVKLKLTGTRDATRLAKERMTPLVNEIVSVRSPQQDYETEKAQYGAWRKLVNAKSNTPFRRALGEVARFDQDAATDIGETLENEGIDAARDLAREYFEDEYEDIHEIYRTRGYATYLKKVQGRASQGWRDLVRELENLEIEESYDGVFATYKDCGFAVDTSYNSLQLTSRRKGILNTSFAVPSGQTYKYAIQQNDDAVRCATYDQVMPRLNDVIDLPTLHVLPVFKAVMGPFSGPSFTPPDPDTTGLFGDLDFRCLTPSTRAADHESMYVQLCTTASASYVQSCKQYKTARNTKTVPWRVRRAFMKELWDAGLGQHPYCCDKRCVEPLDLSSLALMQAYLNAAKEISDHDPVLLGVRISQFVPLVS